MVGSGFKRDRERERERLSKRGRDRGRPKKGGRDREGGEGGQELWLRAHGSLNPKHSSPIPNTLKPQNLQAANSKQPKP